MKAKNLSVMPELRPLSDYEFAARDVFAWRYSGNIELKRTLRQMDPVHKRVLGNLSWMLVQATLETARKAFNGTFAGYIHYRQFLQCSSAEARRWEPMVDLARQALPSKIRSALQAGYGEWDHVISKCVTDLGYEPAKVRPHLAALYFPPEDVEPGTLWLPPILESR